MNRQEFGFREEPNGDAYATLLRFLSARWPFFQLVVQPDLPLSPQGASMLRDLAEHVASGPTRVSCWPGTQLCGREAELWKFISHPDAVEVLINNSNGLFEWTQPKLPEDLSFVGSDESVGLLVVAHECDAGVWLDEVERAELLNLLPTIGLVEV